MMKMGRCARLGWRAQEKDDEREELRRPISCPDAACVIMQRVIFEVVFCNFVLHLCEMCGSNAKSDVYMQV